MAPSGPPPARANAILGAADFLVLMCGQCRSVACCFLLHRSNAASDARLVDKKKGA
jgi:hypothetical protein